MSTTLIIILSVVLTVLILLSAFFSAAEIAYASLDTIVLKKKIKQNKKSALLIKKHYKTFGWTLATILISNNLVNISSASLLTYLLSNTMGASSLVAVISTFIMTPIVVIFGEIIPKLFAKKHAYGYVSKIVYIIHFFNIIFYPLTFPLKKIKFMNEVTNTEKQLKNILTIAEEEKVLEKNEATLAKNALEFDSIKVAEVMTLKKDIVSINKGSSIKKAIELFKKTGFSRLPVKDKNKFIGIIVLKDIVLEDYGKSIDLFMTKKVVKVSRNHILTTSLEKVRSSRSHMAFVYSSLNSNNLVGIVTLEDIIEELVGEIYDEHDKVKKVMEIGLHKYKAQGSARISQVSEIIGYKLPCKSDIVLKKWLQVRMKRKVKEGLSYKFQNKVVFKIISNKNNEETIIKIIIK